jgi:hypothetical protein
VKEVRPAGYHRVDLTESSHPMEPAQSQEPTAARTPTRSSGQPGLGYRIAAWIVPERNPAGAVYGIITIGALLAAESGARETYPETVGSAAIAVVLYWFAHSYADVLGLRLTEQRRLRWRELWHTFVQDWAIVRGASMPLLALLVAWAAGAGQTTALTFAVWTAVASLIAFEIAAGIRSRAGRGELVLQVLVGVTMGLAILALRALLH